VSRTASGLETAPKLRIEAPATRKSTRLLSELVAVYLHEGLGLPREAPPAVRIRLAIVEVLANVARHAYAGRRPGPMVLEIERDGESVVATVRDRGVPFDPTEREDVSIPGPESLQEGGYGLGILRSVMDDLAHTYSERSGNVLTMRKRLRR
jgi:serine/threonine-protein kinase RsbW